MRKTILLPIILLMTITLTFSSFLAEPITGEDGTGGGGGSSGGIPPLPDWCQAFSQLNEGDEKKYSGQLITPGLPLANIYDVKFESGSGDSVIITVNSETADFLVGERKIIAGVEFEVVQYGDGIAWFCFAETDETRERLSCSDCYIESTDTDSSKCLPIGNRDGDKYCSLSKQLENQKSKDESCNNNYECASNVCSENKCFERETCNGCQTIKTDTSISKCLPIGTRDDERYCSLDKTMEFQKSKDEPCNNNYECISNICTDKKCLDHTFFQKVINWFRNLFG